jgi:LysM repeat protein
MSIDASQNPKAQAKAAKAYAKAMRPWYKKKRVLIPAGFVTLALVGTAMGSSGSSSTSNSSGSSTTLSKSSDHISASSSGSKKSGTDHTSDADNKSGTVGQAVTNAGTTYKVTNVHATHQIGDPELLGARADGEFVVVDLNLTNKKNETKTFLESTAKLVTRDGKEYKTSDKAVMAFGDNSLMLKDIQPDLTTRGKLAFDVPPSKVSGSTLVIDDIWGSGQVKVDLGL